jgi:hypothetical protein
MKKKLLQMSVAAGMYMLVSVSGYSLGLDLGIHFFGGVTAGFDGAQVDKHPYFFENTDTLLSSLAGGTDVSADIIFSPSLAVNTGLGFMNVGRTFTTVNTNKYANGTVKINYSCFQIPLCLQYRLVLKQTTKETDSLFFTAGPVFSLLTGDQVYKDDKTTSSSTFLQPSFSIGCMLSVEYSHTFGVGNILMGMRVYTDMIPQSYKIGGNVVNAGYGICITPVIGYSIPIMINSAVKIEQEKKRRIDVIER